MADTNPNLNSDQFPSANKNSGNSTSGSKAPKLKVKLSGFSTPPQNVKVKYSNPGR